MQNIFIIADFDGMSGVISALKSDYHIEIARKHVN